MSEILVSNGAELSAALAAASSGDIVRLAPGNYGDFQGKLLNYSGEVTITSADPEDQAVFDSIYFWNSSNITVDGVSVIMPVDETTTELDEGIEIQRSSNITIKNTYIEGGDSVAGIDPNSPGGSQGLEGILGYPIGIGIDINRSTGITLENNELTNFNQGILLSASEDVSLLGNHVFDLRSTPLFGNNVSSVLVEGNHFEEIHSWALGGAGDHSDFIAFTTHSTQTEDSTNIVIRDNFLDQGTGDAIMGIYFSTFEGSGIDFIDVVIEGNVIHTAESTAMRLGTVDGLTISDNTLLPLDKDPFNSPGIVLIRGTKNVLIENNVLAGVSGIAWDEAEARNVVFGDNLVVQANDPTGQNYVGDLFLNAFTDNASLEDLRMIPGGGAEGYGSAMSEFDTTPADADGFIWSSVGSGDLLQTITFDANVYLGAGGEIDFSTASVDWDFGDGTSAVGESVIRNYTEAGTYLTKATVTLENGEVLTLEKTVTVEALVALDAPFEGGLDDMSDILNEVTTTGNARVDTGASEGTLVLDSGDDSVAFEGTQEIRENSEFSISFGFQKDAASLNDNGIAMYYSGTAVMRVFPDRLQLVGQNDAGEQIVLDARDVELNDTDWHYVTYTYSQDSGTAKLYLDGASVAEQTGLTGAQHVTNGHSLMVGGPSGTSLTGNYDEVSFVRKALSDEDAAKLSQEFLSPGTTDLDTSGGNSLIEALNVQNLASLTESPLIAWDVLGAVGASGNSEDSVLAEAPIGGEPEEIVEPVEEIVQATPAPEQIEVPEEDPLSSPPEAPVGGEPEEIDEIVEEIVQATPAPEQIEVPEEDPLSAPPEAPIGGEPEDIDEIIEEIVQTAPAPEQIEVPEEDPLSAPPEAPVGGEPEDIDEIIEEIVQTAPAPEQIEVPEEDPLSALPEEPVAGSPALEASEDEEDDEPGFLGVLFDMLAGIFGGGNDDDESAPEVQLARGLEDPAAASIVELVPAVPRSPDPEEPEEEDSLLEVAV